MEKNIEIKQEGFYVAANGGIVNAVYFAENVRESSVEFVVPTPTEDDPEAFETETRKVLIGDLYSLPCKAVTYAQLVSALVRMRYSQDDVEAIILNNRNEELVALNEWRAASKAFAATVLSPEEELFPQLPEGEAI